MHRTESKIDKVLFSGENENFRFSIFDFKNAWMTFLKQVLRHAQRTLSRREKGSNRWHQARRRVAKIQRKIANCRKDFLHKLSTALIRAYGIIAIEDLSVKGICQALRLGKSAADAALGELIRQLHYKAQWYGREIIKIDCFARSTGVCPECGLVGPKLGLEVK